MSVSARRRVGRGEGGEGSRADPRRSPIGCAAGDSCPGANGSPVGSGFPGQWAGAMRVVRMAGADWPVPRRRGADWRAGGRHGGREGRKEGADWWLLSLWGRGEGADW